LKEIFGIGKKIVTISKAEHLVVDRAKQLTNELILSRGAMPPFSARNYAELLGIRQIIQEDIGEASGMLLKYHDGPVIQVNSKHNNARQDFSIAHELGHLIVDGIMDNGANNEVEFRSASGFNTIERLCNVAATELLMPEEVFNSYLEKIGISIGSVPILSNIFKVSLESTIIRISELSKISVLALCWKHLKTSKGECLRLAWSSTSKNVEDGYKYKPTKVIVGPNEAIYRALNSDEVVKNYKEINLNRLKKKCPMESKGFGLGTNRRVLSLAFIQ
jgi:Zn-dependent peptidase ImmA (M78 family)